MIFNIYLLYEFPVAKLGSKAGNQIKSREFLIWKERGGGGGGETEIWGETER